MIRVVNLQRTPKGSCGSSFSGQLLAEVEIRVKEGGTSLHKTFRKMNLVFKGLINLSHYYVCEADTSLKLSAELHIVAYPACYMRKSQVASYSLN